MTPPPRPTPRLSFRNVPPAIYLALAINLAGSLAVTIALLRTSGDLLERYRAVERWRLLDAGCDGASSILFALGLFELAKRLLGPRRTLTQLGAGLGLSTLAWLGVPLLIALYEPSGEAVGTFYDWFGRGIGMAWLAAVVLLTIGADAWRRAPLAAVGLVALGVTSYWIPVVGKEISEALGPDPVPRHLYGLARLAVQLTAFLFVVASLAASGRDPAPDPRAAAGGLRLARGALLFRIAAAVGITMLLILSRAPRAAELVAIAGPATVIVTMVVFAVALQRIAGAGLDGMPRLLLSLGAALTLWWATIQLEQVTLLVRAMKDHDFGGRRIDDLQWLSVAGPIVATLGLALVGSAIVSFAARRGDDELRGAATARTITFVALTLAGIGIPAMLPKVASAGSAMALIVFSALPAIFALLVLAGLLEKASGSLASEPGIPTARVV